MMKKLLVLLVVLMVSTAVGCPPQVAPVAGELKLAASVGDWAELSKRVTRILLKDELGYVVIVREAAADTVFAALVGGELDIFTEVWYPNQKSYTDEFVPHQVKIAATVPGDDNLEIRVIDTGIGIKKEDMDKLFQPFQQIDVTLTKKHKGTGLGLHLTKRLVTLLGGDISARSEYGRGSELTFTLPLRYKEG